MPVVFFPGLLISSAVPPSTLLLNPDPNPKPWCDPFRHGSGSSTSSAPAPPRLQPRGPVLPRRPIPLGGRPRHGRRRRGRDPRALRGARSLSIRPVRTHIRSCCSVLVLPRGRWFGPSWRPRRAWCPQSLHLHRYLEHTLTRILKLRAY